MKAAIDGPGEIGDDQLAGARPAPAFVTDALIREGDFDPTKCDGDVLLLTDGRIVYKTFDGEVRAVGILHREQSVDAVYAIAEMRLDYFETRH